MVPVLDQVNSPLMPCNEKRARKLLTSRQAFSFWKRGVFCIKLMREPSARGFQRVAVGIDPGSKREAYMVATKSAVVLNILSDTVDWVKDAKKVQREMRRGRRFRNTPCREPKSNNKQKDQFLPPSTKARWQAKLRVINFLSKLFPITDVIVEDLKAKTKKGQKRWNSSFSPLEVGKEWFYSEVEGKFNLHAVGGYDTKKRRGVRGWAKSNKKLEDRWDAHNVDSHCLAEILFGREIKPTRKMLRISFLQFHRRQLHRLQSKNGERKRYGGTMSLGLKRGSLVEHKKLGTCYVGGFLKNRISLHSLETGKRLCQNARVKDCVFKTYLSWRFKCVSPCA
jgi:hypothetical protein